MCTCLIWVVSSAWERTFYCARNPNSAIIVLLDGAILHWSLVAFIALFLALSICSLVAKAVRLVFQRLDFWQIVSIWVERIWDESRPLEAKKPIETIRDVSRRFETIQSSQIVSKRLNSSRWVFWLRVVSSRLRSSQLISILFVRNPVFEKPVLRPLAIRFEHFDILFNEARTLLL